MGLVLERPMAAVLLVTILPLLWLAARSELNRRSLASSALRIAGVALVVLALAGFAIEREAPPERVCVVVATDLSEGLAPFAATAGREWLTRLTERLSATDSLGEVVFARTAEVLAPPTSQRQSRSGTVTVDHSGTDLEAGIAAALPLCPEAMERKVLLVTDGNETIGEARRAAITARQMDVRLYPVVPPTVGESTTLEKVIAPPVVRQGSVFPLRFVVRREGEPLRASLDVAIEGQPSTTELVDVERGLNVFEMQPKMPKGSTVHVRARIATPDGKVDERKELMVPVSGPIRALVVTEEAEPALARALRLKDVEVEYSKPKSLPTLQGLLAYDCVIVDDVPRASFPPTSLVALESYVRELGGGLIFTGGLRSFGEGGYAKSSLERLLPVEFVAQQAAPKARKPMGVFLVVDRSKSMSYSGTSREVQNDEKIRYARQAALALIGQLRDDDHVGVIAFDAEPYVLGGLRPLKDHRAHLVDRIRHLSPGGGTDFKEALEIAGAQLAAGELRVRHIILLTDGDSNRGASEHDALVANLASLQISVTTLRIGLDDVNLELLRNISQKTQGTFYHVANLNELPDLLVRDAQRADQRQQGQKSETPPDEELIAALAAGSEVLKGFSPTDFPPLRHPVKTQAKPLADVVLSVGKGASRVPLLATWQVGLGRAAVLSLDPSSAGAALWASWPGYAKLWSQLVRWTMRDHASWETRQAIRYEDGRAILDVETSSDLGDAVLEAELSLSGAQKVQIPLRPVAVRAFTGALPPVPAGDYLVKILRREGSAVRVQKSDMLAIGTPASTGAPLPSRTRRRPNPDLLQHLAKETGGVVDPTVEEVAAAGKRPRVAREPLDVVVLPLAIGFFLGAIALGRP